MLRDARRVFLRQAWQDVKGDGGAPWIDPLMQGLARDRHSHRASAGRAHAGMLAAGVSPQDSAAVARMRPWQTLVQILERLDQAS